MTGYFTACPFNSTTRPTCPNAYRQPAGVRAQVSLNHSCSRVKAWPPPRRARHGAGRVALGAAAAPVPGPAARLAGAAPGIERTVLAGRGALVLEGRQQTQLALARFIEEGHFASHIRRMRRVYAGRRQLLEQAWRRELGDAAPLSGATTGMHVVAELPPGLDREVSQAAWGLGIVAQSLASLSTGPAPRSGLVLGYGAAHDQEVRERGAELARLVAARLD